MDVSECGYAEGGTVIMTARETRALRPRLHNVVTREGG